MKTDINIVYSSSESYMKCTGVSIISLFENNRDVDSLLVYILSSNATQKSKNIILRIANDYGRIVEFIDASAILENFANEMKLDPFRGNFDVYASLLIDKILPLKDRVLMIDSDTLIVGSINDLWNTELGSNVMAAVPEIGLYSKISSSEDLDLLYKNKYYYNTGVILYDLKTWRSKNIGSKIKTCMCTKPGIFKIVDQSIINAAINDKIKRIHLKYNYYTAVHQISYKTMHKIFSRKSIFDRDEFEGARRNTVIIHFVGLPYERPWFKIGVTPYKNEYIEYLRKSPWKNDPLDDFINNGTVVFKIYDFISILLRKLGFYNLYHWYRYVLGQYIKQKLKINR